MDTETKGHAERMIQTVVGFKDHLHHSRPGIVTPNAAFRGGMLWEYSTKVEVDGKTLVYKRAPSLPMIKPKEGISFKGALVGQLWKDGTVRDGQRKVAEFRDPGLFPEVCVWLYEQIVAIWELDNEFAAKWASYDYHNSKSKDLKTILAAFMLVQSRKGDPVLENGSVVFHDDDYRGVGEAMVLRSTPDDRTKVLSPRHLLRIRDILNIPGIAALNRKLGFTQSDRTKYRGRWASTVRKWLSYREANPNTLKGLVKSGQTKTVKELVRASGYKPQSAEFFQILRWPQRQAKDGRRELGIGDKIKSAETWEDLTEEEICQRIAKQGYGYKAILGRLSSKVGLTPAIMAAAIEAKSLSGKDLIIATPTLEEFGLLKVPAIKTLWDTATREAEDQRAANVARNVKSKEAKDGLIIAEEAAITKVVEEVTRNMRIYFFIDVSASMTSAIEQAKLYLEKLFQGFPLDRVHAAVFNNFGKRLEFKSSTRVGVNQALKGIAAGGGTTYGAGVLALKDTPPADDEDSLFIFIGDEEAPAFTPAVISSGLRPSAFGLVKVVAPGWGRGGSCVSDTAAMLKIPCFNLDQEIFEDPYALPQALRALIAATPVGQSPTPTTLVPRLTLVDQVLQTALLEKPAWAA